MTYIVINENEIVKAEMERPSFSAWEIINPCVNKDRLIKPFQEHCLSLPRIAIEGKHKWKLWQEVVEGKDFKWKYEIDLKGHGDYDPCDKITYNTFLGYKQVIAIPIQPTPEPIVKGKEKCTCNEFTKIADCKKDCDITPQGKAKYDEAFEWFRSLTINQRQHIRWLYGNPHDGYMSREKTIEVYERRDTEYAKNIIIKTTAKANKQPTPEGEKVEDYYPGYQYQRLFNAIHSTGGTALQGEMDEIIRIVHKDFPLTNDNTQTK